MPGLAAGMQKNDQLMVNNSISNSINNNKTNHGSISSSSNGFWSKHRDDINYNQLQKFWSELSTQARHDLLRIEKQTLFEQARKSMYCSRCNGLLLEGFMQIVLYGKSLQHDGAAGQLPCNRLGGMSKDQMHSGMCTTPICVDETQDPSVHPWGGLITTRDGALTLLDCYLYSKSLKGLQNVFDSARVRERERELLYPDACGGDGRGWISQGIANYGRGHGTRETCALHTAKLSCDTLVDFWSALGEETHHSLLRMKEEDFIERLMYRFDSKRFCRDCRRNVIREFKELKEWKRMRREPRCTNWFCVADTAFQYEVSNDTIYADWHQTFIDSIGTYHHFEWALGSGEGKADILDFENVGMNGSVEVNGLDLDGLNACFITLRAWKLDGRCSEFSVKAHALKGRQCVHCRLTVGDGYVTITRGESIRRFFEHAEEAEEEEDDDSMDKDGNDLDGECTRPQKHAKSPELAREFLLDAATVIFREQVEKAFREGTARQNAHSIFVCLALKLLEERIHVACKEIITLEKQLKLLEEEENEKREEEERKERKRNKDREKKLRRKERLRGKDKDKKCTQISEIPISSELSEETLPPLVDKEVRNDIRDSMCKRDDTNVSESASLGFLEESSSNENTGSDCLLDGAEDLKKGNGSFTLDGYGSHQELKGHTELLQESSMKWADRCQSLDNGTISYKSESKYYDETSENFTKGGNYFNRQPRTSAAKFTNSSKFNQKVQCFNTRTSDGHSCGCNQQNDFREKVATYVPKAAHRLNKFNQIDYSRDNCGRNRSKISNYSVASGRDSPHIKKVWEPIEPQKRCPRSNSDSDVTLRRTCDFREENDTNKFTSEACSNQVIEKFSRDSLVDVDSEGKAGKDNDSCLTVSCVLNGVSDFSATSSSSSDNCSSYQSEGDSNAPSLNHQNVESSSVTDSEDSSEQSEGRESSLCVNGTYDSYEVGKEKSVKIIDREAAALTHSLRFASESAGDHLPSHHSPTKTSTLNVENGVASVQQGLLSSIHNPSISFPIFQGPSSVGFYHQNPVPWSTSANGLMPYHPSPYLLTNPVGYGANSGSNFFMQYGQVPQLASPFMHGHQYPLYQPIHTAANILTPQEITSPCEVFGGKDITAVSMKDNVVDGGSEKGKFTKLDTRNSGFSLFQFGGPVALPTYRSSDQSSDEPKTGEISNVECDHACGKKEATIEEYNLFANGIQFSIF